MTKAETHLHTPASTPLPASISARPSNFDVAIVGAGLSGSLAAVVLGRQGYRVALLDRYVEQRPEFRVEKIAGSQIQLLRQLGLLDCVASIATPFGQVINARHGQVVDNTYAPHYGILYHDLVNIVRAQLPASVAFIDEQVVDAQTSSQSQQILFADGTAIRARLLVLATGMHDALRNKLGIVRRIVFEKHSISFGFNVLPGPNEHFEFPALTYYGERISDRIDYLNIFPIGNVMRANLFTFCDHRDPWIRDLRRMPEATLHKTMPGLRRFLGDFQIDDKVQNWIMDLYVVENYRQHGVVLIGDAFQTSCPAAGTGVGRLLADVHQLCNLHLPRWLATPGMDVNKITQFYDDPVKQKSDDHAKRLADYRRALTIDDSWRWQAHRYQTNIRRRVIGWARELRPNRPAMQPAKLARKQA